jgi:hypothetical protein
MHDRRLAFVVGLAVLIVVTWMAPVPLAGQSPTFTPTIAPAPSYTPPRTAWGDPDLQGVWSNATTTPWQRPAELAAKEFYTDEEVAKRDASDPNEFITRTGSPTEFYERGVTVRSKRTSLIIDPRDGRLPPLNPEGRRRNQEVAARRKTRGPSDSWTDRSLPERCLMYRGLPPVPSGQNNNYNIVQTPEYVAIFQEHIHEVRVIYTDGRAHLPSNLRQWFGDSRGRWQGNTLVVETTNFYGFDKYYFRVQTSIQVSDEYKIVEYFTRVAPDLIDYTFTVSDPKTWDRPWIGHLPMTKLEGYEALMSESACHEGNVGMTHILTAARVEEKKAAEDAARKAAEEAAKQSPR